MTSIITCTPKSLPRSKLREAAKVATSINPSNHPVAHAFGMANAKFAFDPDYIAASTGKVWHTQGVHLGVGFLDPAPADLRARILAHMNAWSVTANVSFVESSSDPPVRIAFQGGAQGGYWSYVGTDILSIGSTDPTMNLESFSMDQPESEFTRVVRHETGHTLGFVHEHMRAALVEEIDADKAIAFFGATQGWSADEVRAQVLTPIEESSLTGTSPPDPYSIMCYQIPGTITKGGDPIVGGLDIDSTDYQLAAKLYPQPSSLNVASTRRLAGRPAGDGVPGLSHVAPAPAGGAVLCFAPGTDPSYIAAVVAALQKGSPAPTAGSGVIFPGSTFVPYT